MTLYKVVGAHPVAGHKPGDSFEASYSEEHERFLVEAGHVRVVKRVKKKEEKGDG